MMAMSISGFTLAQAPSSVSSREEPTVTSSSSSPELPSAFVGDRRCDACHKDKAEPYLATAHHRTSRLPDSQSVAGPFLPGKNKLSTLNPHLSFTMEVRDGHFYQTADLHKPGHTIKRTEEIDIVLGSATKGQTYLFWKGNELYELPVSYWTELRRWVNSPGYIDGSADFDRPVTPRCLECHATFFQPLTFSPSNNQYNRNNFVLGISCERCHGPGLQHVQSHLGKSSKVDISAPVPPFGLSRDREIDICAQCHGGVGKALAPAFSFAPGDALSQYIVLPHPEAGEPVDVHGNQVALLERSRCFQSSSSMSCSTCHDVHSPERPAASYSAQCLQCHQEKQCGMFATLGAQIARDCIDCHMPVQSSKQLMLDVDDTRERAKVRNHWIRVYSEHDRH
jgi:hypothetical protein